MSRISAWLTALAAVSAVAACNAILGIEEGVLRGGSGGAGAASGGSGGTSVTGGAGTTGGGGATGGTTTTGGGGATGGTGGASTCPPWDPDETCASDMLDDPDNCCHLGRSCQGGTCVAGQCSPVRLDDNASTDTRGIDVSGNRVFWSTGGNQLIKSRLKDGNGYLEIAHDDNYMPSLTTDDSFAYWTEWQAGNVMRAPLSGAGPVEVVGTVNATAGWGRLDAAPTRLFWATANGDSGVWAAPIDTLSGDVFAVASESGLGLSVQTVSAPIGVAVDATHVYFSDPSDGVVLRRAIASVMAEEDILADVVAISQSGAGDLALDDTHAYWVTGSEIHRRSKDGSGVVQTLAAAQAEANALVVDDLYVTWVNNAGADPPTGTVQRIPKEGGAIEVLAIEQKAPWEIAQDCTTVYWTNHNDFGVGEIWKVAK